MTHTRRLLLVTVLLAATLATATAQRVERPLTAWRFTRADNAAQSATDFDDRRWQAVKVPHDWAIAGPFDRAIDRQIVAIEQNGEREATEKTGRSGSLPWIGTGWYRTRVDIAPQSERVLLAFDGAMSEPQVWVNGHEAGGWKYGYTPFQIDITPYINKVSEANTIAVRLTNVEESSRWYPGAGLYRSVTLITTRRQAIAPWGVGCETLALNADGTATVRLSATVENAANAGATVSFEIQTDTRQRTLLTAPVGADGTATTIATIGRVTPWTPERPRLYTLMATLADKSGTALDVVTTRTGFRTVSCTREGFRLNGVARKIKGVCLHHDLGLLGSAVNRAALARQLLLLKEMGCDAIRTSHNTPSQWQMELCDSLGLMVMAEAFDMWRYPKCKNGYARFFDQWAERDLRALVLSNRLHPSVVMWSVGNEIPEQGSKVGPSMLRRLQDIVRKYDKSLPVTTGMDRIDNAIATGFAQVVDVPGLNYRTHRYRTSLPRLGQGFILGSETASTVSSRGVYKFPVVRADGKTYSDGQCSAYDTEACWWSNVPEDDWLLQDEKPWVVGEFVWTGFDYLGEPTPYDEFWPSRSSYFGIFDLAGLPKDRYWLYRSRWAKEKPTVHLLPHWTWPGREGELTPVYCYTNAAEAELFLNGRSLGKRTKHTDITAPRDSMGRITDIADPAFDRYRLRWNDVRYEPGELRVVCYDSQGKECGQEIVRTASKPYALRLTGDETLAQARQEPPRMRADGDDMLFLTVSVVDKDGTPVPTATDQIEISVRGAAAFQGACNGDATSLEPFTKPTMRLFSGKLVIALRSATHSGTATVTVRAKGLRSATATVKVE